MNRPEVIFVSSPVIGLEEHRESVHKALNCLRNQWAGPSPVYHYMYEYNLTDQQLRPHEGYAETIVRDFDREFADTPCTIFLLFFSNRIGSGTREEFNIFKERIGEHRSGVILWWKKINVNEPDGPEVAPFMEELFKYSEETKDVPGYSPNKASEFGPYIMGLLFRRIHDGKR